MVKNHEKRPLRSVLEKELSLCPKTPGYNKLKFNGRFILALQKFTPQRIFS